MNAIKNNLLITLLWAEITNQKLLTSLVYNKLKYYISFYFISISLFWRRLSGYYILFNAIYRYVLFVNCVIVKATYLFKTKFSFNFNIKAFKLLIKILLASSMTNWKIKDVTNIVYVVYSLFLRLILKLNGLT